MSEIKKDMPVVVAMALCVILVFAPVVLGDYAEMPKLEVVGYSVFIGVFIAFAGYGKTDPNEPFDAMHFIVTPITGVFAGVIMALLKVSYSEALTWLANAGVVVILDYVGKALVRRFWSSGSSTAQAYTQSQQAASGKG